MMTKRQLVEYIGKETKLSKTDIKMVIDLLFEQIMVGLENDSVRISHFGTFVVRKVKARTIQQFADAETKIKLPAREVVRFRPALALRNWIA